MLINIPPGSFCLIINKFSSKYTISKKPGLSILPWLFDPNNEKEGKFNWIEGILLLSVGIEYPNNVVCFNSIFLKVKPTRVAERA